MSLPKILIIEDEPIVIQCISSFLGNRYEVRGAADGETGLSMTKTETPDLIILDLRLPRKDGYEVLKEIKNDIRLCDIPVIIVSNVTNSASINECFRLGADSYLVKTDISAEIIKQKIEITLNS